MPRSPVWNRGCMLVPCVLTYVVEPPSASGHKTHTAASSSATAALMLAALGAALMAEGPVPGSGGAACSTAPPDPARSGRGDRETHGVEVRELGGGGAGEGLRGGGAAEHTGVHALDDRGEGVGVVGERQLTRLGRDRGGRREHDVGQHAVVQGVDVVVDGRDGGTGDVHLAVTEDAVTRRRQVVSRGEGGGGGGGSGDRDTGEQNARLAHCRVLFSQVAQCRPGGDSTRSRDGCALG